MHEKKTTPRLRNEINSRETQRRKSSRDNLSEKEKQIIKAIETKGKRVLRDKLSNEQKMAKNAKETKGRKVARNKLSNEQKLHLYIMQQTSLSKIGQTLFNKKLSALFEFYPKIMSN